MCRWVAPPARRYIHEYPDLLGAPVPARYPYELKLPLAPYRFVWRDEPAVDAAKTATELFTEERYTHADGTTTIIREYRADGSFHILSDRGEIGRASCRERVCSVV